MPVMFRVYVILSMASAKPVAQKVFQVDVQVAPVVVPFQKTMYFSDFGPLFCCSRQTAVGPGPAGQESVVCHQGRQPEKILI